MSLRSILVCGVCLAVSVFAQSGPLIDHPDAEPAAEAPRAEVARLYGAGGYWAFVRQAGGDIGIVAAGGRTWEVLQKLTAEDSFSVPEIYQVLSGTAKLPAALQEQGARRAAALPTLSSLLASTPLAFAGQSKLGRLHGAACEKGDSTFSTFDGFKWGFWQGGTLQIPGVGRLEDIGANGHKGIGTWPQGPANLVLGSTSAGAAAVCFPQGESNNEYARITVQEFYGNGLWIDLWTTGDIAPYEAVAYGYWFKGAAVRKIRLLVRDMRPVNAQNPPIGPFYWAAAY